MQNIPCTWIYLALCVVYCVYKYILLLHTAIIYRYIAITHSYTYVCIYIYSYNIYIYTAKIHIIIIIYTYIYNYYIHSICTYADCLHSPNSFWLVLSSQFDSSTWAGWPRWRVARARATWWTSPGAVHLRKTWMVWQDHAGDNGYNML